MEELLRQLLSRLGALETKVALLAGDASDLREDVEAVGEGVGAADPTTNPASTDDEIEVDSNMHTYSGRSGERDDRSLEWAANEISVLRLFAWSDTTKRVKRLPSAEESSSSDGIRFLARVPKDADDPSKGAELRYFKLLAGGGETTDTETSATNDKPGESIEHYEESSGASGGPLQLRGFADENDTLAGVAGLAETASSGRIGINTADVLVRSNQDDARAKLEYVHAEDMPYWLRNGTYNENYARSIALGSASIGYIRISATT